MSLTLQMTLGQAEVLRRRGEPRKAAALCQALLTLDSGQPEVWHLLGVLRLEAGDADGARAAFEKAIDGAPGRADFRVNLATALKDCGELRRAAEILRQALSLDSEMPVALYNLGNTLLELGYTVEAKGCFARAIALKSDYAEAHNNLGHIERLSGDSASAIVHFQAAVAADPQYGPAWANLCAAQLETGRIDKAIEAGRIAVLTDADAVQAQYNLGNAFAAMPNPRQAAVCYQRALQIDPDNVDALVNFGVALQQIGDCDAAIAVIDRALALSPALPQAHWNKAITLLLSGNLLEAWALYEWRWQAVEGLSLPDIAQPQWDGSPLGGRRILIHAEQGYGDTLQFVRYLPMVRASGGRVVLECPLALKRLLLPLVGDGEIIAFGEPRPAFDVWLPLMSLPRVFQTSLEHVPARCPYLPQGVSPPTPEVISRAHGPKVGLVWRGSLTNNRGRFRSCRLADFAPLLAVTGVSFFGLQTELTDRGRATLDDLPVDDLSAGFGDFADTAAAVRGLDLVITVDTAVAHLAGALGRPVWTILSAIPDWRWLRARNDSPWYPTMRLFRQGRIGDWTPVMTEVAAALAQRVQAHAPDIASSRADEDGGADTSRARQTRQPN